MTAPALRYAFFLDGSGPIRSLKWVNNRSVMPLDVLGRTRVTMARIESVRQNELSQGLQGLVNPKACLDWD